jgi:uncharacterized membrane protein
MVAGIHKLSSIMRESGQLGIVLGIATALAWILLALMFLGLRGFDLSGIGIIPVVMTALAVYLAYRVVDHGIRTLRFAAEWERRYQNLLELERKMAADLGLPAKD